MNGRSKRYSGLVAVMALAAAGAGGAYLWRVHSAGPSPDEQWSFLNRYCVDCHNRVDLTADVAFDQMAPSDVASRPELFEETLRKLRGDLMPPPGGPRPDPARLRSFVQWVEATLDEAATESNPGYVVLHRLNRAEYANEIERLLDLKVDPAELLPPDTVSDGFSNVANVLQVSPTLLDEYIAAAREISIRAVGDPQAEQGYHVFRAPARSNQTVRVPGLPLGTRGGMLVEHFFPADGEYLLGAALTSVGGSLLRSYPTGWLEHRHVFVLTVDDEIVFEGELGGEEDLRAVDQDLATAVEAILDRFRSIPVRVAAGRHRIGAAFVARTYAESDAPLEPVMPGLLVDSVPIVAELEVLGPLTSSGVGETASRRRVFVCHPQSGAEEVPCANEILSTLARRAFRRPVDSSDMDVLLGFYHAGARSGGFERGIQRAIMAMLASPHFLYRVEPHPDGAAAGAVYDISQLELASRLSFFLWSQGPDEELLALAERGRLADAEVLRQQVLRMLADARAMSLVRNFAFQWLQVNRVDVIDPDPRRFPTFDDDLRAAFRKEMELFLGSVLLGDESVLKLLDSRYTFVDERLARHYGIQEVRGARFRRVELDDSMRWGLLGKGAVLMLTSYPDRTSPVLRGQWILETLIGAPPAAPPPDVETNLAGVEPGKQEPTVRERLEQHRRNPSCNQCHGAIDPLGMALEGFDAIAESRHIDRFAGAPIDASGQLPDGTPLNGPDDLRHALLSRTDQFVLTFVERLMTYALGRTLEHYDMPAVRRIARDAAAEDHRFSALVIGIVESEAFRTKRIPDAEAHAATH